MAQRQLPDKSLTPRLPQRRALALLVLLLPTLAAGQAYRWTDESGKVHFSDRPPPDTETRSEEIEVQGPAPIGQGEEVRAIRERTMRLLEAEQEERREERRAGEVEARKKAAEQRRCDAARRQLKILSGRVRYVDESGRRYDVSEERVAKDREKVRQWIEENCS